MKIFNSFQVVTAFIAWPWLVDYLAGSTARGASVGFYAACAVYVAGFLALVFCVFNTLDSSKF